MSDRLASVLALPGDAGRLATAAVALSGFGFSAYLLTAVRLVLAE
jgi:hypothetical protein